MLLDQWYAILSSKAVNPINCRRKRLNLGLALFRNEKGEIGCIVDQCIHRSAVLSKGMVKENLPAMPFSRRPVCLYPRKGKASTADIRRYIVKR